MSTRAWVYGGLSTFALVAWASLGHKGVSTNEALMPGDAAVAATASPTTAAWPVSERRILAPAARDAFAAFAPPPPPAPPPAPAAAKQGEPPPPPPAAPILNLRFAGRMLAPDGSQIIFATLGNDTVMLAAGASLSNGYRVEKVSATGVELVYPPLSTRARLDIPAAPAFEVR